jgi:hypothetical protein
MKTLERFWQWHDTEKPETARALKLGNQELSPTARYALDLAATVIDCHQDTRQALGCRFCTGDILEKFPGALRTLSLAVCAALEVMEAAVPRGEPTPLGVEPANTWAPWWSPPQHLAATEFLIEHNRTLAEIDRSERLTPKGIIFYDPDKVPEGLGDIPDYRVLAGAPPTPPERLHWVSLSGCPGCGSGSDLYCMDECPLRLASPERRARAKAIQAEQRLLAACDQPRAI